MELVVHLRVAGAQASSVAWIGRERPIALSRWQDGKIELQLPRDAVLRLPTELRHALEMPTHRDIRISRAWRVAHQIAPDSLTSTRPSCSRVY